MINAIFACDEEWGIGKDGSIPWNNRLDLKWFKESTLGNVVVMGRKTYESLPGPLSMRDMVVISRSLETIPRGFLYNGAPDEVWPEIKERFANRKIFIIGGAQLFGSLLGDVDELVISRISGTHECDTFLDKDLINTNFVQGTIESPEGLNLEKYNKK